MIREEQWKQIQNFCYSVNLTADELMEAIGEYLKRSGEEKGTIKELDFEQRQKENKNNSGAW